MTKREAIVVLLEESKTKEQILEATKYTMGLFHEQFLDALKAEEESEEILLSIKTKLEERAAKFMAMAETTINELLDKVHKVYEQNLTEEEATGLATFFKTPLGKALNEKFPVITRQGMELGKVWGQGIMQRYVQEAQKVLH